MKKLIAILLLFVALVINAQTRFIQSNITAPFSPTVNAGWTQAGGNTYKMMYPGKNTFSYIQGVGNVSSAAIGFAAPAKGIIMTFISQPLQAQTLASGSTFSGQLRCAISTTSGTTGQLFAYVRKCNEDGTTLTEIGNCTSTNMSTTPAANRTLTFTLGSNITINAMDRLIVEVGWNYSVGTSTIRTALFALQASVTASDLPVDNTATGLLPGWFEFSQTILFVKI